METSQKAPELQIHAAATLVMAGDPFSLDPKDRADKTGEIAQFVVPIEPQHVGKLRKHHIDKVFENLKLSIMDKLRKHGVMEQGQ